MAELADVAEPPPPPVSRSLRVWYGVIQTVAFSVFAVLCWSAAPFEKVYADLGMTRLPAPTELFLAISPFFRTVPGLLLLGGCDAALVTLGFAGKLDRVIRKLVVFNVIGTLVMVAFFSSALYLPLAQIRQVLQDK